MTSLSSAEVICAEYVIPTICVFGVVCNVLNVIVLTRKHMTESPYTYLTGLGLADLGVLVLAFGQTALSTRLGKGVYFWKIYDGFIFYPFANVFANSSVWITVLLTVERFISVQFPLRAKDLCTRSVARKSIICVFVLAIVFNIPRFFCQRVVEQANRTNHYILQSSDFEMSYFYQIVTWVYIILIHLIPLIIISTLNTSLVCALYRAERNRHSLAEPYQKSTLVLQNSREQRRLTATCIAIIILFLICIMPSAFSNRPVAMLLFSQGRPLLQFTTSSFYRALKAVTNMLVFINSSLNFILYCVFNHKFMITLQYLCKRWVNRMLHRGAAGSPDDQQRKLSASTPLHFSVRQVVLCSSPPPDRCKLSEMTLLRLDGSTGNVIPSMPSSPNRNDEYYA